MITLAGPWTCAAHLHQDIQLLQVPMRVLRALANGDQPTAQNETLLTIPDYLVSPECQGVWLRRVGQIAQFPGDAPWVTRLIVDGAANIAVGRAGFHGPPDAEGMVEVGYSVDHDFRRHGYARAALAILLETAGSFPDIHTVRATISPGNLPSRALVEQFGFVEVGEQWDDEDGLEIIFEVASPRAQRSDPPAGSSLPQGK